MSERRHLRMKVTGRVQGVAFRWHTRQQAMLLGVTGTVRNRVDGSVLIEAEGTRDRLEALLDWTRRGPAHARVDAVDHAWSDAAGRHDDFLITG